MLTIYDCSNSSERPEHRGNGGPIENDVVRYLRENADAYDCMWVEDPKRAQVIFTNDIYPKHALELNAPRVKRMDGMFWQDGLRERNVPYVEAAKQSDEVIFISDYSMETFSCRCNLNGCADNHIGTLKSHQVIHHWVDPKVFNYQNTESRRFERRFTFAACASNWARSEKRLGSVLGFARLVPEVDILLIGTCPTVLGHLPKNVRPIGYLEDPKSIAEWLNRCHGFLNLTYRDAAPKTVPQALSCGLPVLYAFSGGVPGMVPEGMGVHVMDGRDQDSMEPERLLTAYRDYAFNYDNMFATIQAKLDASGKFKTMLGQYYAAIRSVVKSTH